MPSDVEHRLRSLTWHQRRWEVAIALAAGLLYARTVGFGWAFDDQMDVVRNTFVRSFAHFGDLFRTTVWAGSGMETYLYRPLSTATFALNHAVSGLEPWSYHLVNVLLHVVVSLLVFRLGRLWRLPVVAAGLGALLFAVHPVHVEVAANVAGRKDLLAAVFLLGMVLTHRHALARGPAWGVAPTLLYACAMLSKEIGVVGLLLVALQDAWLEEDRGAHFNRPGVIGLYFGYMGALTAFLLVRLAVTGVAGVPDTSVFDNPLVAVGLPTRLATAVAVIGKGVALLLAPLTLSPDYSFDAIPVVTSVTDPRLWATLGGSALLAWALARPTVRRSMLPLALGWYVLTLLPGSNLPVTVGTIFGERLLYLPSVAFCLVVGWALARVGARTPRGAAAAAVVAVLALSLQTVRYSGAWSDDIALFQWAVRSVPESTKAHHKLGEELLRTGDLGGALRSLNRALAIAPDNAFAAATLGQARSEAVARYAPGPAGRAPDKPLPADPDILCALGRARRESGDLAAAERYWRDALAVDSLHAPSLVDLGAARLARADTSGAAGLLNRAVRADPSLALAWFGLARIELARGDATEAARALGRFLATTRGRDPDRVRWARGILRELGGG